jgi:RNA polymerase sigma-70 factor (ECF subfamily)
VNKSTDKEYWQLLWDKFKAGDKKAFETIYNEFVDVLFDYGCKITSDKTIVEDAIQDLFIDIYKNSIRLRHPEYLEFYLFKSLKRIIIRKLKEYWKFDYADDSPGKFDFKFLIEEERENEALEGRLNLLQKEIKKLDAKKRELIFLKFNSALTYAEIGKLLDLKPDTVKKQIQRLIKNLRGKFGDSIIELFVLCFIA